jgi:hypothetical protein
MPRLLAYSIKASLKGFIGGKDLSVVLVLPSSERTTTVVAILFFPWCFFCALFVRLLLVVCCVMRPKKVKKIGYAG